MVVKFTIEKSVHKLLCRVAKKSNAACSGRDRKLTMEVCFIGLAIGVLDFRNMLPRVKVEPNQRLENGVAAVFVPFFCTLKRPPGLVWATLARICLRLAKPAGESSMSHRCWLYFVPAMHDTP